MAEAYIIDTVRSPVGKRGGSLSQIHPVLDGKNRPIFEPPAFDINTSIQRCLVKAIALHGRPRIYVLGPATVVSPAVVRDLQSLGAHGLIERRTIWAGHGQGKIELVALTSQGRRRRARSAR